MSVSTTIHRRMLGLASTFGPAHAAVTSYLKLVCQQQGCQLHIHPYVWTLRKHQKVIRFAPSHYGRVPHVARRFDVFFDSLLSDVVGHEHVLDFSRVHVSTYRKPGLAFEFSAWPDEEDVLDAYLNLYRPSQEDLVYDIGARCGVSTYVLSQFAGKVVAFEEDSLAFALLQRNIERHQLSNVTTLKSLPVLADVFSTLGTPAFCKIDVEGAELAMLTAAQSVLSVSKANFAVRTTHDTLGLSNQAKVEALLHLCGFDTKSDQALGITYAWPEHSAPGPG